MTSIVKKKITAESTEAIQVFVRVRPPLQREILENNGETALAVSFLAKDEIRVKSKTRDARCKFDHVFPPQTTQENVYNKTHWLLIVTYLVAAIAVFLLISNAG